MTYFFLGCEDDSPVVAVKIDIPYMALKIKYVLNLLVLKFLITIQPSSLM